VLTALWPYAHVADVQRSIDWYGRLGLELWNTHEAGDRLVWAFVGRESAGIMLALADGPVDPKQQAVLFYGWTEDVAALQRELGGRITKPFYMPAGELRLEDPDGYVVLVGQLGEAA
jgi:catechol 2,3-dioxygenase-like lactoylglutathione lyase family enzyme